MSEMVWYCMPEQNMEWCNNFFVGRSKTAFVGIDAPEEAPWHEIEKNVDAMLASFKFYEETKF